VPHDDTLPWASIALVGTGPRGIAVLERLAAHLSRVRPPAGSERPRVVVIDATELGAGRIWAVDQPPWLLMNTVAGELTLAPPEDPACPLPDFLEWLGGHPDPPTAATGPHDYVPRHIYGQYLHAVYAKVLRVLRTVADVEEIQGRVHDIAVFPRGYRLSVAAAAGLTAVDAGSVILATGHAAAGPTKDSRVRSAFADSPPYLLYLGGGLVSELDLDAIPAGADVAVIGLGLSFYDLLASVTVGRGGEFAEVADGLVYEPSGKEPVLHAASRSGLPIGTRGMNQKAATDRFRPRILTPAALARLRETACRDRGTPQLDFAGEVLPLLLAEAELVFIERLVGRRDGGERAQAAVQAFTAADPADWDRLRRDLDLDEVPAIDLARLARPFTGTRFGGPEEFTLRLAQLMQADVEHARLGNVDGPLKAALDVIRDCRDLLRAAVEFEGSAASHPEEDFFTVFAPLLGHVSTGPPVLRTSQFLALLKAGVVQVAGPEAVFGLDSERGYFTVESPSVAGSLCYAKVLVDTRVPPPMAGAGGDPLLARLCAQGVAEARTTAPGGIRVTPATGRVVGPGGVLVPGLYATGVPTEGFHWFTQIGNGRPGIRTSFHREADSIALDIIRRRLYSHA
jgi:uncharacterized NAD(P)/FAD-binding protein YdhS